MSPKQNPAERHEYAVKLQWTGARNGATTSYQAYSREYELESPGKPTLRGSADPHFRGDASLYNPEDLLVASLSACHLLTYLAECARAGVHVVTYEDDASGVMSVRDEKLRFTEVVLRPRVTVSTDSNLERAIALHHEAHEQCFVANSVNFPVRNEPVVTVR